MMSIEIKVPELPESVADAVVASWHKQVGDVIQADEVLVDLETDKSSWKCRLLNRVW